MKWYSVHGQEIKSLAVFQGLSAFFFALASFCGGVWISTMQGLQMANPEDIEEATMATWSAIQAVSGWTAIACLVFALALLGSNAFMIYQITKEHDHE